ncbi:embryonic protein UVS.2-like [Branchiostoma lanceolatum]|uniref:embryonic protein UVS.2-like n=1 Tax=Branchiostoma lanceolatum TaxID=7740 RepID=UPI0034558FE5
METVTKLKGMTVSEGELSVDPITSTSNKMSVSFTSDGSLTAKGFQIFYEAGCGLNERQCFDGSCIPNDNWCDGVNEDCPQAEDELDCKVCPIAAYVSFNGVCYKYFAEPKTYHEAKQTCMTDRALLAMPKNRATNSFINGLGDPGCGFTLTAPPEGTLTSPNYPNDYGNNENCTWTITVPEGRFVRLTLDSFNAEDGIDILTIYDGHSDSDPQLQSLTGDLSVVTIDPIISTTNKMFVRFTSDESLTAQGFRFSYRDFRCGLTLTAPPGGTVTSPNYPNDYGNNETCEWTIIVSEGQHVRLTFDSFNIEDRLDILTIYDGDSDRNQGKDCYRRY